MALLEQGAFNATYKYAVLLALMDVCLEQADETGTRPRIIHPRTLATRVELYWHHASVYGAAGAGQAIVLRQNRGGQAEVVTLIQRFRAEFSDGSNEPPARARVTRWHIGASSKRSRPTAPLNGTSPQISELASEGLRA